MPKWRKATWALVIFNILVLVWLVTGLNAAGSVPVGSEAEEVGRAIGTGIGVSLIVVTWFIGFIVLGLVWLMSRPKESVVIYGPAGQAVTVNEGEAKRRIAKGWTYTPPMTTPPAPSA